MRFSISYLFFCGLVSLIGSPDSVLVESTVLKSETLVKTVSLIGRVKADHQTMLFSEINGTVEKIAVLSGSFVKKGTLLVQLKNESLQKEYELLKNKEKYAKRNYDRYKDLFNEKHVSKMDKETAKERWLIEQMLVERAKKSLDNTLFIAPFDGVCGIFKVSQGSSVKIGDGIVEFCDLSKLHIYVDVPEDIIGSLKDGQVVLINERYDGKILAVQKSLDPDTHMGAIKVKVNAIPFNVGGIVTVRLESVKKENSLGVPQRAILLEGGKMNVYVVKEGKAKLQEIEIGFRGDSKIEIKKGLKCGDIVILGGQNKLYDGCPVILSSK